LAIKRNFIWEIESDQETYNQLAKEMNDKRKKERSKIDEETRKEEEEIRI